MESLKNWMVDAANILFDDSKNDLRSLPRSVRLQILLVLSFIWTTVFSLYIFSYTTFAFGWAGLYIAHIGLIFAILQILVKILDHFYCHQIKYLLHLPSSFLAIPLNQVIIF